MIRTEIANNERLRLLAQLHYTTSGESTDWRAVAAQLPNPQHSAQIAALAERDAATEVERPAALTVATDHFEWDQVSAAALFSEDPDTYTQVVGNIANMCGVFGDGTPFVALRSTSDMTPGMADELAALLVRLEDRERE